VKNKKNLVVKCKGNYGYKFSEFQPLKEVHKPIKWERQGGWLGLLNDENVKIVLTPGHFKR
jgi:DNA mismatch repair protein MutH